MHQRPCSNLPVLPLLPMLPVLPVTSQQVAGGAGGRGEALISAALCEDTATPVCRGLRSKAHCPLHSLFHTYVYKILFRKVTLVTLLLGPAKTPFCQDVRFPTRKRRPGCHIAVLPKRQRCAALASVSLPGVLQLMCFGAQRKDKLYNRNLDVQIFKKVRHKLCSLSTKRSLPRRSGRSPLGLTINKKTHELFDYIL